MNTVETTPVSQHNSNEMLAAIYERVVPYQKCPICDGSGYLPMMFVVTAINTPVCDVCKGQKIIPMHIIPHSLESKKSYDLEIGDEVTPTVIISPLRKSLTDGKIYTIINFDYDHKQRRVKFQIIDDNGNKKWYRLDTFHRRWRSV